VSSSHNLQHMNTTVLLSGGYYRVDSQLKGFGKGRVWWLGELGAPLKRLDERETVRQ
jgi:hypothetical protein